MKNAEQPVCKLNGFKLLNRWIEANMININSVIEYNPSAIIELYIMNIKKSK